MAEKSVDELLKEICTIDTPTITNVVATYPKNPLCLGLYNPWTENWYTDTSIRCIYPEMKPTVGYAVTCVYGLPDPNFSGRLTFNDVLDALDASPKPTILVMQQKWPPELMSKAGLAGEMMVTQMKIVGCVGMISNGPSRDVDAIRRMGFQLMLERRDGRPRRDGRAVGQRAGLHRRHGRGARRNDPHGRERRGQVPGRQASSGCRGERQEDAGEGSRASGEVPHGEVGSGPPRAVGRHHLRRACQEVAEGKPQPFAQAPSSGPVLGRGVLSVLSKNQ